MVDSPSIAEISARRAANASASDVPALTAPLTRLVTGDDQPKQFCPLVAIELDHQAIAGFFPCDHHYSREDAGTKATHGEPSYGYIEPVATRQRRASAGAAEFGTRLS